MKIGYYPCFVKSYLPASVSARTDCLNRAGIVAYGTARNWTTLLGIMTPVMGPRSAWWNVNVLGSLDSVAIFRVFGNLVMLAPNSGGSKYI